MLNSNLYLADATDEPRMSGHQLRGIRWRLSIWRGLDGRCWWMLDELWMSSELGTAGSTENVFRLMLLICALIVLNIFREQSNANVRARM